MNYTVKIGDRAFTVEIQDLNARPVIALVDGEPVEVWPEGGPERLAAAQGAGGPAGPLAPLPAAPVPQNNGGNAGKAVSQAKTAADLAKTGTRVVRAPIPGVIVSWSVKTGDIVLTGQELCVLEAMKMKNIIRSTRDGVIGRILAPVGQTVKHHDILVEFEEGGQP